MNKTSDKSPDPGTRDRHEAGDPDREERSRRRALLTAISAAGVAGTAKLPEQWTRPVVDYAVLPVHAQTTTEEPGGSFTTDCVVTCEEGDFFVLTSSTSPAGSTFRLIDYQAGDYTMCMDTFGGVSLTTVTLSSSANLLTNTFFTVTSDSNATTAYTTNSICVVGA